MLSLVLAGLTIRIAASLMGDPLWRRLLVAVLAIWLFTWLSPQAYYAYYQFIFEGLPDQIVIQSAPSLDDIARLLTFQAKASLSDHSKGALGWLLILMAVFQRRAKDDD